MFNHKRLTEVERRLSELESKVLKLEGDQRSTLNRVEQLSSLASDLTDDIDSLAETIAINNDLITDLSSKDNKKRLQIDALSGNLNELDLKFKLLKENIDALREELNGAKLSDFDAAVRLSELLECLEKVGILLYKGKLEHSDRAEEDDYAEIKSDIAGSRAPANRIEC